MKGKRFSLTLPVFAALFALAVFCPAQDLEANLKIESVSPPVLRVEGKLLYKNTNKKNWSFLSSIAGIENLGERISDLTLKDASGETISYKKLIAGEYLAEGFAANFSYRVDLAPPKKPSSMAHVSWLADEEGLLMLDDLLPQFAEETSAKLIFELPADWTAAGINTSLSKRPVDVEHIEKAVFQVGKNLRRKGLFLDEGWREKKLVVSEKVLDIAISGEWLFLDAEAVEIAGEVLGEYENLFGEFPTNRMQIFLLKFPKEVRIGNWEAETRGSNIVILSSDMPFKNQSVQRLHEQLRHELFHLWIPNNMALTGNYDWFYEGFALYQSLRTGVNLNRIRFEDFLDTLARAYDLDSLQSRRISLIEASKNRWSGANAQIYARGMLVAFLSDVSLLRASKGKRSISDVLRDIYRKHQKPSKPEDGNSSILSILESHAELRTAVGRYIKGAEKIDWRADLEAIGIETNGENFPAKLTVRSKLTARQKDLLNDLGYNNWRKLSQKSK